MKTCFLFANLLIFITTISFFLVVSPSCNVKDVTAGLSWTKPFLDKQNINFYGPFLSEKFDVIKLDDNIETAHDLFKASCEKYKDLPFASMYGQESITFGQIYHLALGIA